MAILWAGTSIADMASSSGTATTTSGAIATTVSEGINCANMQVCLSPTFAPTDEFWFSETYQWAAATLPNTSSLNLAFCDTAGTPILRMRLASTGGVHQFDKWSGSAWSMVAQTPIGFTGRNRIDIHVKIAASGWIRLYVNGALLLNFEGNTLAGTGAVNRVILGSGQGSASYECRHSAFMFSDADTRALDFYQRLPTGNGAETDWTGGYTDVDETGINDADFVKATSVGDTETFTFAALPSETNSRKLEALVLSGRSRSAGSIQRIKGISRVGGTNYEEPAAYDASPAFNAQQWVIPVNPATGNPWTGTEVDGAQFGVRAA